MGLPPIRRSVTSHKVTPKEPENDAARTKPQPPSVVCERFKIEGNNYFRGGKFELAEHAYSKAIEALKSNPIPWANRAQARLKLKKFKKAEEDCDRCLQLDPEYTKAIFRRGCARQGSKQYAKAILDFEELLRRNPSDAPSQKMLEFCKNKMTSVKKNSPSRRNKKKSSKKNKKNKKKILIEVIDGEEEEAEEKRNEIEDVVMKPEPKKNVEKKKNIVPIVEKSTIREKQKKKVAIPVQISKKKKKKLQFQGKFQKKKKKKKKK